MPPPLPSPPPYGDNNADDQCRVEATRDPSSEEVRPRATQSASLSSPPSRAAGGEGHRTQRPVAPGIMQPLGRVPPHGCFLVVIIVIGGSAGGERTRRRLPGAEAATEEAAAAVIMTCFDVVFLVWWQCAGCDVVCGWERTIGHEKMMVLHYQ